MQGAWIRGGRHVVTFVTYHHVSGSYENSCVKLAWTERGFKLDSCLPAHPFSPFWWSAFYNPSYCLPSCTQSVQQVPRWFHQSRCSPSRPPFILRSTATLIILQLIFQDVPLLRSHPCLSPCHPSHQPGLLSLASPLSCSPPTVSFILDRLICSSSLLRASLSAYSFST